MAKDFNARGGQNITAKDLMDYIPKGADISNSAVQAAALQAALADGFSTFNGEPITNYLNPNEIPTPAQARVNSVAQDWFNNSPASAAVNPGIVANPAYSLPSRVPAVAPAATSTPFMSPTAAATSTPLILPAQSTQAATSTPSGLPAINNPPLSAKYREAQARFEQQGQEPAPISVPQRGLSAGDQIASWVVDDGMTTEAATARWKQENPEAVKRSGRYDTKVNPNFSIPAFSRNGSSPEAVLQDTTARNKAAYDAIVNNVVDNGVQADQATQDYRTNYPEAYKVGSRYNLNDNPNFGDTPLNGAVPANVPAAPASVSVPARNIPTPNQVAYPQTDNDFAVAQAGQRTQLPVQQPQTMLERFQQAIAAQPQRKFSDPFDPNAAPLNYRSARR